MFENKKETFPDREESILEFWDQKDIFKKSLENRKEAPLFSFYDGPPFATGLPHYGHLLAGTIKDVLLRYKTMEGFFVPRRFGWDCHGIPVENEIEKIKKLSGAASIKEFGVANFNEACRSIVLRYTEEWKKRVKRMGRWIDCHNAYRTMDPSFMETVWWVFGQLWEKGLIYEGFKVMPFSAELGTPLSNFEANLNYKEVDDPAITVALPLQEDLKTSILIWTTTPWTLPSNLAAVVHPDLSYVKVYDKKRCRHFIVGKASLSRVFKDEYEVVGTFKGKELEGKKYTPPFNYFLGEAKKGKVFTVLCDEFVGEEEGTGIVHVAPAFGEVDFFVCQKNGIEPVCPVDQNGIFTEEVSDFSGLFVKDADKGIIKTLKEKNLLFEHRQIHHRYPFCWRSETPLIYKTVHTWFVSVEKIKESLLLAAKDIYWMPNHIKEGRFGKWLENARDWAISRSRYWGTPLPIWRSLDGECKVITSISELEQKTGQKISDIHSHLIDHLTFEENGKQFKRVPEVFDCWFESGSMPYAKDHFPFENKEEVLKGFPADFIAEGLDQTRGWFYTLNVLSVALFDKPAFKNVIVNGIILAEDGTKMSKRLKNYPDPDLVFKKFGADATRLYLLGSPAVEGDDLRFSERGVELALRQFLIPFWNAYVFLSTYANIYQWKAKGKAVFQKPQAEIDQWIISLLNKLMIDVNQAMDRYSLKEAVEPFTQFIDALTNWYIRRNRARFWAEEDTDDRREAFETLYRVLFGLSKVAAPFIPFISEAMFQHLRKESDPESVHLCDFPKLDPFFRNERLEKEMATIQTAVSMGHGLRKENKLKVRQPLQKAHLISADKETLQLLKAQKHLVLDELNVKEVIFHEDETAFVKRLIKPNFKTLGKKVGPLMRQVQEAIKNLGNLDQNALEGGETIILALEEQELSITKEDVLIERQVKEGLPTATEGLVTIALETKLSEDLLIEGLARELVNKINTQRRNTGFEVTDRIKVIIETSQRIKESFKRYESYITHEVLATKVLFEKNSGTKWDLNGEPAVIHIEKVERCQ